MQLSVKNEKTWCPSCAVENRRTRTIEDMKKFAEKKGGFCFTTEYVNRRDPKASAKDILKGTWCRRCSILGRKHVIPDKKPTPVQRHDHVTHQQCAGNFPCGLSEAKEIAHSRGGMCLSTEYINLCVPMQWMCNKGHKWFASFNSIKHVKSWCPYCLNKHENLCREVITNSVRLIFRRCFDFIYGYRNFIDL